MATQEPTNAQASPQARNQKLSQEFCEWLVIRGFASNTLKSYKREVAEFLAFIGDADVTQVDQKVIREFLHHRHERGHSPASLERCLYALRSFFDSLGVVGAVRFCAPRLIQNRRMPRRLPRVLTEAEIEKLISAAETPRDLSLVEFMYATGCRVSEIANMKLAEIDFKARTAMVRNGKGGKDRAVCFGRPAAKAIKAFLKRDAHQSPFLFAGITTRNIGFILQKLSLRAGIPRVNPHALRHTFATHCLNNGMGIRYVQELLGHSSLSTTQIYTHVATDALGQTHAKCHPRG
jgi:site-specific recombinase XerD